MRVIFLGQCQVAFFSHFRWRKLNARLYLAICPVGSSRNCLHTKNTDLFCRVSDVDWETTYLPPYSPVTSPLSLRITCCVSWVNKEGGEYTGCLLPIHPKTHWLLVVRARLATSAQAAISSCCACFFLCVYDVTGCWKNLFTLIHIKKCIVIVY